ncbi:EF-hand domain-containing protein [Sphingopyxis sp.]|jgi:Tfp pilus assembly protein PilV|uniref:EF-hand domain-containing protein n=1 Tax=Sphingopyxis sp. TaxID=1908224 RepID=UPI003F6FEA59
MNKKIAFLTLGAALIAVPVIAAPGAKGDADGNGTLTRAEAQAHATQMFARMDANKDGKIDPADRAAQHTERQAKMFAAIDADGNGSISKAEWDQHRADRAAKRAERGDKRADAGEAGEGKRHGMRGHGKRGGHHGMRGGMMAKADTNGDKAISQAEFQTAALARFDAADANKDGQVTAEERQAQRGEWRAKRAAPSAAPAGE